MSITLKKCTLIAVVLMVAMSITIAPAAAQPDPPHEIYGTVTDQNGNGVSGETVTVAYDGTDLQTTTTDSNGDFTVQVTDPDGQTTGETLTVTVAGNSETTTFEEFASERIDFSITVSTGGGGNNNGGGGNNDDGPPPADTAAPDGGTATPGAGTPEPVSETVDLGQNGAAQITLSGGTSVTSVTVSVPGGTGQVTVRELPTVSADTAAPPGQYITGVDISSPDPPEGQSATVSISISQSRLDDLGVSAEQLVIQHYRNGAWQTLETSVETRDGEAVVSAQATGFSPFAITTQDQAQVTTTAVDTTAEPDTATPEPDTATPTDTQTPTSTGTPGFGVIVALTALLAVGVLAVRRD